MPLLSIWSSNPNAVAQYTIDQVVKMAGDGNLRDASNCADEFRAFLSEVRNSGKLAEYVETCLITRFDKSGLVLQDLVNELGRRLDYNVKNGKYQGTAKTIG